MDQVALEKLWVGILCALMVGYCAMLVWSWHRQDRCVALCHPQPSMWMFNNECWCMPEGAPAYRPKRGE